MMPAPTPTLAAAAGAANHQTADLAEAIEALRHVLGMDADDSPARVVNAAAMIIKHNANNASPDPGGWREFDAARKAVG